jgi:hypothetical protein
MALVLALMSRNIGRWIVFLLLCIEGLVALAGLGSRTELFVLIFAALVGYNYFVRQVPTLLVFALAGALILVFLVLGTLRSESVDVDGEDFWISLVTMNEFTSVFLNALDALRLQREGLAESIFPAMYYSDLMNAIPQQLLPFEKLQLGRWYVETFYPDYAEMGGGLAFGIVAESVVGLGAPEIIIRGLLLGSCFAGLHAWVAKSKPGLWKTTFYVWLLVWSYQVVRSTSLVLVPMFVYHFLPVVVAFKVLEFLLTEYQLLAYRRTLPTSALTRGSNSEGRSV